MYKYHNIKFYAVGKRGCTDTQNKISNKWIMLTNNYEYKTKIFKVYNLII